MRNRFRWFGHAKKKYVDYLVRRVDEIENSHVTRDIGRPRKL